MKTIQFLNVTKRYSAASPAVDDVSLEVAGCSFVVLLGPSGCGKTTLLKMVNRLIEPTSGQILLNGQAVRAMEVTELRRQIGYVIQQVGLFPHMTVGDNIAVVPELMRWPRERIINRVDELLDLVSLPRDFRTRYPSQLSGGQQQRVGIARALAADPGVLLMDEPFGAIDAITRTSLQEQLLELQRRLQKTILFVTHDVDEALRLADRIVIMQRGKVVQYADPCALLNNPANDFVRELLNTDDRVRQLGLIKVKTVMKSLPRGFAMAKEPRLQPEDNLRAALSLLLQPQNDAVIVIENNHPVGMVRFDDLRSIGCRPEP